jgi:hypothetical protein
MRSVDKDVPPLYARPVRWLFTCVIVFVSLQHRAALAQNVAASPCPPGAVCTPMPRRLWVMPAERDYGRVAFAAGAFGAVASGLVLGGSIAMSASDEVGDLVAARAAFLGFTVAAAPAIAFSALATRNRVDLKAQRQVLWWAVSAWIGAAINGGLQLSATLHDLETPPELTIVTGVLGCVGLAAFTLDALTTAHRARIKQNYRVVVGPSALTVRF